MWSLQFQTWGLQTGIYGGTKDDVPDRSADGMPNHPMDEDSLIDASQCFESGLAAYFFLEKNPAHKMIPVLIHGEHAISESLIILEYIDDTWKHNPFLPNNPTQRAYARFWAKFSEDKILEASRLAFHYTGEKHADGVRLMGEGLEILEREIQGKKFFGGDEVGYLDLVLGWIAYWLHFNEGAADYKVMDPTKYPGIDQWINNFLQVDIIKNNLPPYDEMSSTYKMYRKMSLAVLNVTHEC